jgi:hypothetical protein
LTGLPPKGSNPVTRMTGARCMPAMLELPA